MIDSFRSIEQRHRAASIDTSARARAAARCAPRARIGGSGTRHSRCRERPRGKRVTQPQRGRRSCSRLRARRPARPQTPRARLPGLSELSVHSASRHRVPSRAPVPARIRSTNHRRRDQQDRCLSHSIDAICSRYLHQPLDAPWRPGVPAFAVTGLGYGPHDAPTMPHHPAIRMHLASFQQAL